MHSGVAMSDLLTERLNKILPRVVSNDFLKGSGIGNEIAFYIFDYSPEDELRVREHIRFLLEHITCRPIGSPSALSCCSESALSRACKILGRKILPDPFSSLARRWPLALQIVFGMLAI
jgi:hypothetical protein